MKSIIINVLGLGSETCLNIFSPFHDNYYLNKHIDFMELEIWNHKARNVVHCCYYQHWILNILKILYIKFHCSSFIAYCSLWNSPNEYDSSLFIVNLKCSKIVFGRSTHEPTVVPIKRKSSQMGQLNKSFVEKKIIINKRKTSISKEGHT